MVSGIIYVFMGFVGRDWSCAVEFIDYEGPHWCIDNYRLFNYLSDFAENRLKGVCMCQDDTCDSFSQSDHRFKSYNQKFKCSIYVYHWMRHIKFRAKILAASDTESDCAIHCTWVLSLHLYR